MRYNEDQPGFRLDSGHRSEGETQVFCLEWPTCNLNYACQATSDLSDSSRAITNVIHIAVTLTFPTPQVHHPATIMCVRHIFAT